MSFLATIAGATVFFIVNLVITAMVLSLRHGQSAFDVIRGDVPTFLAPSSRLSLWRG